MISKECFTKEWLLGFRKRHKTIDPGILEKMVNALALVETLKLNGLNFIFKGGTSLILLQKEANRFSIDIDIITKAAKEEIEKILTSVCADSHFLRFELQEHRSYKAGVPKAHYKLFYNSEINNSEFPLLLDILFEENPYHETTEVDINSDFIKIEGDPVKVTVPTVDSILGDKLTAFAPETTGIPFNADKELEIIKQLFDIGKLYDQTENLETVKVSFETIAKKEIEYRKLSIDPNNVLDDIIAISLLFPQRQKGDQHKFEKLLHGTTQINSYLIKDRFRIDEAIEAAGKAAYLAAKIKNNNLDALESFAESKTLDDYLIENTDYNFLNKATRKLPNNSLFYWYQFVKLIEAKSPETGLKK